MATSDLPFVSVVVPVFNERDRIVRTLEALLDQTYADDRYEVVVVDNGSTDGTEAVIADYPVQLLVESRRSSYAARNCGVRATQGEYVVFIDSDCVAERTWLENLVLVDHVSGRTGLVDGRIELEAPERRTMGTQVVLVRHSAARRASSVIKDGTAPAGNLLVARELFWELGYFQEAISGADTQFTLKATAAGHRPVYAHDAVVWHPSSISSLGLLRRTFRTGYSAGVRYRASGGSFLRLLYGVPWRPAVRVPIEIQKALSDKLSICRHCTWLVFLWFERLSGWFGRASGFLGLRYRGDRQ